MANRARCEVPAETAGMAMPMGSHIALYMQSFAGGGAERVMINLAHGLAERGHRVDLIVARVDGPYRSLVGSGVRLVDLNSRRSLMSLPKLVRYLRHEKPEALLSAMGPSNLIALGAKIGAGFRGRVVISVHVNISAHYQQERGLLGRMYLGMIRSCYPFADAIVAVSAEGAIDLQDAFGLPADRIRMIYNPVVSPSLMAQAQETVAHRWFEPGQPPVVLAVGRLCEQKDYLTLLRAFQKLRANRTVHLLILGEGPDRPQLEAAVAEMGLGDSVEMPGFAENPYAYMARAAAYVLSSRWEGLPTVLIEAMACGAPVVSTDCPSGPHEILQGGRYGRLVPVGDADALAEALEQTLEGRNLPAAAESWAAFDAGQAAARYENVLLDV